jgi:sortase (surface protein transpeptidase)
MDLQLGEQERLRAGDRTGPCFSRRLVDLRTPGGGFVDRGDLPLELPHAKADTHPDSEANTHPDSEADSDSDPEADTHTYTYAQADANLDTHADTDCDPDVHTDLDADTDLNPHANHARDGGGHDIQPASNAARSPRVSGHWFRRLPAARQLMASAGEPSRRRRPSAVRIAIMSASVAVAAVATAAACAGTPAAPSPSTRSRTANATPAAVSTAGPSQAPAALSTALPDRLQLPAIGVNAHVEGVGTTPQNAMDVPKDLHNVGWYAPGIRPGQPGDAVIDGHLDWYTGSAVFVNLSRLKVGDLAVVLDADGTAVTFRVTSVTSYAVGQPPADLFNQQGQARLSLITCGGSWDGHQYSRRLVVDAELLSVSGPSAGHPRVRPNLPAN